MRKQFGLESENDNVGIKPDTEYKVEFWSNILRTNVNSLSDILSDS